MKASLLVRTTLVCGCTAICAFLPLGRSIAQVRLTTPANGIITDVSNRQITVRSRSVESSTYRVLPQTKNIVNGDALIDDIPAGAPIEVHGKIVNQQYIVAGARLRVFGKGDKAEGVFVFGMTPRSDLRIVGEGYLYGIVLV